MHSVSFLILADLQNVDHLQKIIITAGNHDSASQMEAYKRLFSKFDIHVVGADSNLNEDWYTDWVVPFYHPSQKHLESSDPKTNETAEPVAVVPQFLSSFGISFGIETIQL